MDHEIVFNEEEERTIVLNADCTCLFNPIGFLKSENCIILLLISTCITIVII